MKNKKRSKLFRVFQAVFLLGLIVGTAYILRKNSEEQSWQHASGSIFGTYYQITYQHKEPLDSVLRKAMQEVDASLSMFNSNSTLSRINRNECMQTDSLFDEVFLLAQKVSQETDGCFDITIAPLVNAWGFGFEKKENVTDSLLQALLPLVGYEKVTLEQGLISKAHPAIIMDCSAIAKGYGVDRVAKALKQRGINNYLVNIGGEVVAQGKNREDKPWRIGVETPDAERQGFSAAHLSVSNAAMATSGNYRRFYEEDGQKFAHTIDPKTGKPAQHNLLSATVVATSCAEADAYATAFMVMGKEKTIAFLENHPTVAALLICATKNGEHDIIPLNGIDQLLEKQ